MILQFPSYKATPDMKDKCQVMEISDVTLFGFSATLEVHIMLHMLKTQNLSTVKETYLWSSDTQTFHTGYSIHETF